MVSQTQNPNPKSHINVFSYLSEKEKDRVARLIVSSDRKYEELMRELKKMLGYFRELEVKFYYLSEEDPKYDGVYTKITDALSDSESI
jgi:hypothetical protein